MRKWSLCVTNGGNSHINGRSDIYTGIYLPSGSDVLVRKQANWLVLKIIHSQATSACYLFLKMEAGESLAKSFFFLSLDTHRGTWV